MVNWRNYFASSILERGRTYQKRGMVQCVEENNGKIDIIYDKQKFKATVTLKNK